MLDITLCSITFPPRVDQDTHIMLVTTLDQGAKHLTGMYLAKVTLDTKPLIEPNDRRTAMVSSPDRYAGKPSLYWRNEDGTWENEDASLIMIHPRI